MATALNPIQMQLLQLFKYQRDEKELEEIDFPKVDVLTIEKFKGIM